MWLNSSQTPSAVDVIGPAFGRAAPLPGFTVVGLVAAGVAVFRLAPVRSASNGAAASLKAVPLTSFPGRQNQVAFSPDGNQIAFVWDGPQSGPSHIYVKLIGTEALLQLTRGPGADSRPPWSPDGGSIFFLRCASDARTWYVTSALEGAERKLADIFPHFDLGSGNSTYEAPDGKSLAIVDKAAAQDPASIFLLPLDGGPRRRLSSPPAGTTGDSYPASSPGGKRLAFARAMSFSATGLYVMQTSGRVRSMPVGA